MTAEEKLALMDWCRNETAISALASKGRPLKLVQQSESAGLRAIWQPVPIAENNYSLCAEMQRDGQLASVTFRNLGTDASLELTNHRSANRLKAFAGITRTLAT